MHAYEVRALPRKRKEIEEDDQQPLFLRKVFSMISTCPPEIGAWSDHGETFVIKDSDRFSTEIIPTAFKHSKFASFVRQLNFCKLFLVWFRRIECEADGFLYKLFCRWLPKDPTGWSSQGSVVGVQASLFSKR